MTTEEIIEALISFTRISHDFGPIEAKKAAIAFNSVVSCVQDRFNTVFCGRILDTNLYDTLFKDVIELKRASLAIFEPLARGVAVELPITNSTTVLSPTKGGYICSLWVGKSIIEVIQMILLNLSIVGEFEPRKVKCCKSCDQLFYGLPNKRGDFCSTACFFNIKE